MSVLSVPSPPLLTAGAGTPRLAFFWRLGRRLRLWRRRRRSRRHLSELDETQLRDIGVSPGEARAEVGKSFPWWTSFSWAGRENAVHDGWR